MSLAKQRLELDRIATEAGFAPLDAYFIRGEFHIDTRDANGAPTTLYTDEGLNYCCDCAETLVAKATDHVRAAAGSDDNAGEAAAQNFEDEHRVVSTQLNEEDGSAQCEECHRTLAYSLSASGFALELDHYETVKFGDVLLPGDAYALARVIDAVHLAGDDEEDEEDANDDTEEDLLGELAELDMGDSYDRERAEEIGLELEALRAAEPKPAVQTAYELLSGVVERALALAPARAPSL